MDSTFYKYCVVPVCKSTSIMTPSKLFVRVPNKEQIRRKWLKLARRDDAHTLSLDSRMYFCEDHFDLPKDMINFMEYHIMGKVSRVCMKSDCIPTKFECQEDKSRKRTSSTERPRVCMKSDCIPTKYECQEDKRRKRTSSTERLHILKKLRMMTIAECLGEYDEISIPSSSHKDTSNSTSNYQLAEENAENIILSQTSDKSVTHKFRSKALQVEVKNKDQGRSSLNPSSVSSFTSKVKTFQKSRPSPKNIQIPSVQSLQIKSSSDCSELLEGDNKLQVTETLLSTIKKIEKKPQLYIGVSDTCYFLIDIIKDSLNIPKHNLLFCLHKIRLDSTFNQLADDYEMTPSCLSKIFFKNIPLIASVMHPFIVNLDSEMTKQTLPTSFRHNFHKVSCIIDCIEIEVQKPSKAINQALSWSDYKKANTIKYLISCTPNGLVNYISPGFGGRITDTVLVGSCDFLKTLKPGTHILANRGFKHVEQYLCKSGVTLVRPPSVNSGVKMSKNEARLTKQIASLRIPIERVIRRLQEFCMLKPHACIDFNFIKILDDIIIIACGLVNLQDSYSIKQTNT